jgi:GTP-dependent phosphoenolpyruvate carboxykinase
MGSRILAAVGLGGSARDPPDAPFCGYHGRLFPAPGELTGRTDESQLRICGVNWFRKTRQKFLWAGFGENPALRGVDRCGDRRS